MDWDDLPRLTAMGKDGPDPFDYDDLAKVIESQYTLGVVCATPTGPAGYMVYVVSDGTGKAARKSGKLHLAAGLVRVVMAKERRRQGVGRFLVDKVSEALVHQFGQRAAAGRLRLHATVNETWLPALLFLKGLGFKTPSDKEHAIQKKPFAPDCRDDGILMERFSFWPTPMRLGYPPEARQSCRRPVPVRVSHSIMWGDVKTLWKAVLSDLASRCQTFIFCSHMANVWQGDRPTGKRKPKGKETLMELASLYLLMERKTDKDGKTPAKPAATVLKSRLVHTSFDPETMEVKLVPCLPPRIPVCTPKDIRDYMNSPPDYSNLKEEEKVHEEKMSADERELLALQKAEAERETERMRLERVSQQREMVADADKKAAEGQAVQTQAETVTAAQTPNPLGPSLDQLRKFLSLKDHLKQLGGTDEEWGAFFTPYGVQKARELTPAQAEEVTKVIEAKVKEREAATPKAWE